MGFVEKNLKDKFYLEKDQRICFIFRTDGNNPYKHKKLRDAFGG